MTREIAAQIAALLNRNELSVPYDADKVLKSREDYVYILEHDLVASCAESKKVQWYQWEIRHVSVLKNMEGKGYGSRASRLAEKKAREGNARILQATIRSTNAKSIKLFDKNEYLEVNSFYNIKTNNIVNVYQKCITVKTKK